MKHTLLPIDGNKLMSIIQEKNMSRADVDRMIGRAQGFTSKTIKWEKASLSTIKTLDAVLGISYNDYKPKTEPVQPVAKSEEKTVEKHIVHDIVNMNDLKDTIYSAVYQAVLDAWQNDEPKVNVNAERKPISVPYV